jgi:hypothetical protein
MFRVPARTKNVSSFLAIAGEVVLLIAVPFAFSQDFVTGTAAMVVAFFAVAWWNARRGLTRAGRAATRPIGQASSGYYEIRGTAEPLDARPLRDPITEEPCLWFGIETFHRERRSSKAGTPSWQRVDQVSSSRDFVVRDETGSCRVRVAGADVELANLREYLPGNGFKYVLYRIRAGDTVYVQGEIRADPDCSIGESRSGQIFLVSDHLPEHELELASKVGTYRSGTIISAIVLLVWLIWPR